MSPPASGGSGGRGVDPALPEVLDALRRRGLDRTEVYAKRGRSRVVDRTPGGTRVSDHREEGWAVRAGDDRGSLFASATGRPDPAGPGGPGSSWPEADGDALELAAGGPEEGAGPASPDAWRDPPHLDAPLAGEREALALLAAVRRELESELPGVRPLLLQLADGASEWQVASSLRGRPGVAATGRGRAAYLRVEAALPGGAGRRGVRAELETVAPEAGSLEARGIARRLADRLTVAARGRAPERDRGELVLAPALGVRLLEALLPLFLPPRGPELARHLEDRSGPLASEAVSVIDDGRLPGGVLAAAADGEGIPTRAVTLVDEGTYRGPLGPGCSRRPGWRDLPRPGPSHLYLAPDGERPPADLLEGVARGYYLLDADGAFSVDWDSGRFSVPVVGFALERGRAVAPLAGAVVEGRLGRLLRGVQAVARDLAFSPRGGGLLGAPSILVAGLEIRGV
ncbi:MAG: metallopeptidase TldD-related protein [Thermoanaerobaculia bacterium]